MFNKNHRAETERFCNRCLVRLLQLSAAGEVFLEGTCPLSRCPQTAKFPVPMLLGTGRRWVRKATAYRGRSEQDRSALFPACCTLTLETFRWNVSNGLFLDANMRTRRAVSANETFHWNIFNVRSIFPRTKSDTSPPAPLQNNSCNGKKNVV